MLFIEGDDVVGVDELLIGVACGDAGENQQVAFSLPGLVLSETGVDIHHFTVFK